MSAAFAAVDLKHLRERERDLLRKVFNSRLHFAVLQFSVLVEEGCNEGRVDSHEHHADYEEEDPNVEIEILAAQTDQPHDNGKNRDTEHKRQSQRNQFVLHKKKQC